jgi:hypothetical protein
MVDAETVLAINAAVGGVSFRSRHGSLPLARRDRQAANQSVGDRIFILSIVNLSGGKHVAEL